MVELVNSTTSVTLAMFSALAWTVVEDSFSNNSIVYIYIDIYEYIEIVEFSNSISKKNS